MTAPCKKSRHRFLLSLALPLGVVIGLHLLFADSLPEIRFTRVNVAASDIPELYIQSSVNESDKYLLVERRASTLRRSDATELNTLWRLERVMVADAGIATFLLQSRKQGSVLMLPVEDVVDWSYVFAYEKVRKVSLGAYLPRLEWVELFVNRIYAGLYLRLDFERPKKSNKGKRPDMEVWSVIKDHCYSFTMSMENDTSLLSNCIAGGTFPSFHEPDDVALLANLIGPQEQQLLVPEGEQLRALSCPLPVNLAKIQQARHSTKLPYAVDERFLDIVPTRTGYVPTMAFSSDASIDPKDYQTYRKNFLIALNTHARFHGLEERSIDVIEKRDQAMHFLTQTGKGAQ